MRRSSLLWRLMLMERGRRVATAAASGQVVFDALGTTGSIGNSGENYSGITVGAGLTNSALIIIVGETNDAAVSSVAINWDNAGTPQAMTLIGTINNGNASLWVFGLRNPTAGNKLANITYTGSGAALRVCGVSFQSVKQTSDAAAFANFNSATGAASNPSVTITSAVGNFVIASYINNDATKIFTGVTGTTIYIDNTGNFAVAASRDAGAASKVMTGTNDSPPAQWAAAGFNLVAA